MKIGGDGGGPRYEKSVFRSIEGDLAFEKTFDAFDRSDSGRWWRHERVISSVGALHTLDLTATT